MASTKDGCMGAEGDRIGGEGPSSVPVVIIPSPNRSPCLAPTLYVQGPGGTTTTLTPRRAGEGPAASHSLSPGRPGDGRAASNNNSLSPTGSSRNNPVHRSFSDLPSHHHHHRSAAGSDVSSETSRASAGASLEKFFTQMGMERDVIDPLLQIQHDVAAGSSREVVFESISSLDSYDARSICSALSRSEKEVSDSESCERNQQQATVVERNARIIKWLCNVKKAKTPATASVHSSASS